MNKQLLAIPGFKLVTPHVCGTCYFHKFDEGTSVCEKHEIAIGDAGDMFQWLCKCSSWRNEDWQPKKRKAASAGESGG